MTLTATLLIPMSNILVTHTDSSCRNLFTQEILRKVAGDVVISHEVVALMTIFAKLFYFLSTINLQYSTS